MMLYVKEQILQGTKTKSKRIGLIRWNIVPHSWEKQLAMCKQMLILLWKDLEFPSLKAILHSPQWLQY